MRRLYLFPTRRAKQWHVIFLIDDRTISAVAAGDDAVMREVINELNLCWSAMEKQVSMQIAFDEAVA